MLNFIRQRTTAVYGSIPIPRSAFPYLCTRHFVHSIFFSHRQGIFDRSFRNWDNHSQVLALANKPPITIVKISDAPKRVVDSRKFNHPLQEMRVLDPTHALAGPICRRTPESLPSNPFIFSTTTTDRMFTSARHRRSVRCS